MTIWSCVTVRRKNDAFILYLSSLLYLWLVYPPSLYLPSLNLSSINLSSLYLSSLYLISTLSHHHFTSCYFIPHHSSLTTSSLITHLLLLHPSSLISYYFIPHHHHKSSKCHPRLTTQNCQFVSGYSPCHIANAELSTWLFQYYRHIYAWNHFWITLTFNSTSDCKFILPIILFFVSPIAISISWFCPLNTDRFCLYLHIIIPLKISSRIVNLQLPMLSTSQFGNSELRFWILICIS